MRGIILAGGAGTRLHPATRAVSKQLLPVYDTPTVYFPLTTLMLCGIREILVVTTPEDAPAFARLLGDGRDWGLAIAYATQARPDGIARALTIGRGFLAGGPCALALGDNIFHGSGLGERLRGVARGVATAGAAVVAARVADPQRYGVVEFAADGETVASLEEKPARPRSDWAVTGLYFYDATAPDRAAALAPSARGELEITDLNRSYLADGRLYVERLARGDAWLDTGTADALHEASSFVRALATRQGTRLGCPEEVAWRMGYITRDQLAALAARAGRGAYAGYLTALASEAEDPTSPS